MADPVPHHREESGRRANILYPQFSGGGRWGLTISPQSTFAPAHSAFMPIARITFAQRSLSSFMKSAISAGCAPCERVSLISVGPEYLDALLLLHVTSKAVFDLRAFERNGHFGSGFGFHAENDKTVLARGEDSVQPGLEIG